MAKKKATKTQASKGLFSYLADMTTVQKVATTVASVGAAVAMLYAGLAFTSTSVRETFGEWPYASRITEVVVAGWQADRLSNDLRDIQSRIERLSVKKKIDPKWSVEDQRELDYWFKQRDEAVRVLKRIEIERRPHLQEYK